MWPPPKFEADNIGIRSLAYGEVGSYKTGCFYSDARVGVPYEVDALRHGIGRKDDPGTTLGLGGPQATLRVVTLLHETAHFVQDLSLGAALERDYLLDESAGLLLDLLRRWMDRPDLRFPLREHRPLADREDIEVFAALLDREDHAERLVSETMRVHFRDGGGGHCDISGQVLTEGLAAMHVARTLQMRCETEEDLDYLADVSEDVQILPEQLGPPYSSPSYFFTRALGCFEGQGDAQWPRDIGSPSCLANIGCVYLCDVACHVPPLDFMGGRLRSGRNQMTDFLPGPRFVKALLAIRESGGFPDAPMQGGADEFYRVVFDLIASRYDWPSFQETTEGWLAKVVTMKEARRSASDAYRARLLVERLLKPSTFLLDDPLSQCWKQGIPILHSTPYGMKFLRGVDSEKLKLIFPWENEAPLHALHWLTVDATPWEDSPAKVNVDQAFEHGTRMLPGFVQEVISRSICRSFQHAVLNDDAFRCPYAKAGCKVVTPECASLKRLRNLPADGCAVRVWLSQRGVNSDRLAWT